MLSRRHARVEALICSLVLILTGVSVAAPAHGAAVDEYSGYEPQTTCATRPLPGTEFLLDWLVREYDGTGYSSTLRDCDSGGTSEHKDGRALDWAVDADDPAQKAQAEAFLERILATDADGNPHALARRMGIMYLIWDDHIWAAYDEFERRDYVSSSCEGEPLRRCDKTLRHRDHVHISLSRSGAAAQTTFYRSRGVEPVPVLVPGTLELDPVDTALVQLEVPADGRVIRTDFQLSGGTTYRVVSTGRYRFGAGPAVGDAACRWSDGGWVADEHGLRLNGALPWATDCTGGQVHEASFTPTETGPLRLRLGDDTPEDNSGSVVLSILRSDLSATSVTPRLPDARREPRPARRAGAPGRALRDERVTVPADARRGRRTDRALRKRRTYRVVVTGLAHSGATDFDGKCVEYAGRFREQHTLDLRTPEADHLAVYVQGERLRLRVPRSRSACADEKHRYVGRFQPVVGGRARIRIWDPYSYTDNSGDLTVRLIRLPRSR